MFHCFPLATLPPFPSSILVLLCPTFFICNAMIVTVKQEPFYTKWLVLFFPRGRERATVRFFIVSSPFSLFSLLSLPLSLSLSFSLSFFLSLFSYVDERKKNAVERKGKLIAWPTRWPTRIHSNKGFRKYDSELLYTVFLSYKSLRDFLYISSYSYSSGGLQISKVMGRDPFISRTHSPFTRDH